MNSLNDPDPSEPEEPIRQQQASIPDDAEVLPAYASKKLGVGIFPHPTKLGHFLVRHFTGYGPDNGISEYEYRPPNPAL